MNIRATAWLPLFTLALSCSTPSAREELKAEKAAVQTEKTATDSETKNVEEYIELLREDLRQEKAEILGSVMQFNTDDAAKFWPIYHDYQTELTKLNDRKVENIKSYAREYSQMTDAKADRLTKEAFDFQRQRADLLAKYYERTKDALGATTAARFLRVENQLLSIIDLQIDCRLPIHGQHS